MLRKYPIWSCACLQAAGCSAARVGVPCHCQTKSKLKTNNSLSNLGIRTTSCSGSFPLLTRFLLPKRTNPEGRTQAILDVFGSHNWCRRRQTSRQCYLLPSTSMRREPDNGCEEFSRNNRSFTKPYMMHRCQLGLPRTGPNIRALVLIGFIGLTLCPASQEANLMKEKNSRNVLRKI